MEQTVGQLVRGENRAKTPMRNDTTRPRHTKPQHPLGVGGACGANEDLRSFEKSVLPKSVGIPPFPQEEAERMEHGGR